MFKFIDQLIRRAIEGMTNLMRAVVTDIIQQRIYRVGDQFSAVFSQPFGRQNLRF